MPFWKSKKTKAPGYSYLSPGVTLEGRLCFRGIVRLDGRVIGDIVSAGTLVVEETAIISGTVLVENLVLNGTVYGDIRAFHHVQLNATSRVFGHVSYSELSVDGALHEGSSHKLTPGEIEELRKECAEILEEVEAGLELIKPTEEDVAQYASALDTADRQASEILSKKAKKAKSGGGNNNNERGAEAGAPERPGKGGPAAQN